MPNEVESFYCKTPCRIFTGVNALKYALFYSMYGREPTQEQAYNLTGSLEHIVSWKNSSKGFFSNNFAINNGVHAKMYQTKKHLIYSSQNNGNSGLYEFAIIFEKKKRHNNFFKNAFIKAKEIVLSNLKKEFS